MNFPQRFFFFVLFILFILFIFEIGVTCEELNRKNEEIIIKNKVEEREEGIEINKIKLKITEDQNNNNNNNNNK